MRGRALTALLGLFSATVASTPPTPVYTPPPGQTVALASLVVAPDEFEGSIDVQAVGGNGSGLADLTTIGPCFFETNPGLNFQVLSGQFVLRAGDPPMAIRLGCMATGVLQQATLECLEQQGFTLAFREWPVTCPAISVPPTLSFSPSPGLLDFSGANDVPLRRRTIRVTPTGGVGTGTGATTTLACTVTQAPGDTFTASPLQLSFTPGSSFQNITLGCEARGSVQSGQLTCTETRGTTPLAARTWDLNCPTSTCRAIPDAGYAAPSPSTAGMVCVDVPGVAASVPSLVASLSVTHSKVGDLTVKLVPPTPTDPTVTLMGRPGTAGAPDGATADLASTHWITFGPQGTASAESMGSGLGTALAVCRDGGSCRYLPDPGGETSPPLSALAGANANGTWKLCVGDSAAANTGAVCGVDLDFPPVPPPVGQEPKFVFDRQIPPEQEPWFNVVDVRITASDRLLACDKDTQLGTAGGAVIRRLPTPSDYIPSFVRCHGGASDGSILRHASLLATHVFERLSSTGALLTTYGKRLPQSALECTTDPEEMYISDLVALDGERSVATFSLGCDRIVVFDYASGSLVTSFAASAPEFPGRLATAFLDDGSILAVPVFTESRELELRRYALNGTLISTTTHTMPANVQYFAEGNDGRFFVSLYDGSTIDTSCTVPAPSSFQVLDKDLNLVGGPVTIALGGGSVARYIQVAGSTSDGTIFATDPERRAVLKLDEAGRTVEAFTAVGTEPYRLDQVQALVAGADGTAHVVQRLGDCSTRRELIALSSTGLLTGRRLLEEDTAFGVATRGPGDSIWILARLLTDPNPSSAWRYTVANGRIESTVPIPGAVDLAYRPTDGSLFALSRFISSTDVERLRVLRYEGPTFRNQLDLPYDFPVQSGQSTAADASIEVDALGNVFVMDNNFDGPSRIVQVSHQARAVLTEHPLPPTSTALVTVGGVGTVAYKPMPTVMQQAVTPIGLSPLGGTTEQILPSSFLPGTIPRAGGILAFAPSGELFVADTEFGRVSVFTPSPAPLAARAIIVSGGGPYPGNSLWDATEASAGTAVRALAQQGFEKESVQLLSPSVENDIDGNGLFDDVDAAATRAALQQAINGPFGADAEDLVVYLVDHGGVDRFRMSETEYLGAAELDGWLDEWQTAHPTGRVLVIVDACHSGSFVPVLAGPNRAVVASAAPDEDARFLFNGALSFSALLFTQIRAGLDVATAYAAAEQILMETFGGSPTVQQTPWLDADGDGVPNEAADRSSAQAFIVGNGVEQASDRPQVGAFTGPGAITGTATATFQATGVVDADGIDRVWIVLQTPGLQLAQRATPVSNLPTVDLREVAPGSYSVTHDAFGEAGTYVVTLFARDSTGRVSRPSRRTLVVQSPLARKAVVVALGESSDARAPAFIAGAAHAVTALTQQGYGPDGTVCTAASCDDIFHVRPGVGGDAVPTLANLQAAIGAFAAESAQNVIVFLTGERSPNGLRVNAGQELTAAQLDGWLDTLQATLPGVVTLVIDADDAGSLLPQLIAPPGKPRVLIASTGPTQRAVIAANGAESYGRVFWNLVGNGSSYNTAHNTARDVIKFADATPTAVIDDNGINGTDDRADGRLARLQFAGSGVVLAGDRPFVAGAEIPTIASGSATVVVRLLGVQSTADLDGATARVRAPSGFTREYPMQAGATAGTWEATVDCLSTEAGSFQVQMHARDENGALSDPRSGTIVQAAIAPGACTTPDLMILFSNGFE